MKTNMVSKNGGLEDFLFLSNGMNPPKAITTQCAAGCIRPSSEVGSIWDGFSLAFGFGRRKYRKGKVVYFRVHHFGVSS